MRSVTLTEFGTEEGFSFMKNCARPEVADDEVLVRVKASAVAPIDGAVRRGDFAQFVRLPAVPGYAVSGVVEKLGMEVDRFKVGDEVIAYKPLEINHEEAVACLLGGIWSYTALHYHFKLSPGETVLVLNGETRFDQVIAAASSVEELNFLNDLRVTLDRVIDLTTESLVDAVMEETGGQGVDFLLETIPLTEHLSTTTAAEKEKREREMSPIISEMVSSEARGRAAYPSRRDLIHVLSDLMEKVSKEEIVPKVTKSFILEKIREAHARWTPTTSAPSSSSTDAVSCGTEKKKKTHYPR
ncbi:alcohol dehydrogenase GroESlike domain containing protein [Acanthamoeba castellanii str. Neff]|uniref:Alcohol dehydrogenase GroESlike domain containing protein n=1 Tax=Acanthamoeba castellanii (strain ATCC 30010 / Neff) TaxID=1257118 RepID=L8GNM8_ACACF|nr:alcohol dehydrogenase GroESlike domain containing protein [Acanthamoeba castellanii str. Neff]ELR14424.1 alcohol dehydrogenase GroESlike domain containing protein [Acanthamoeba castellanii str. Neff]